MARKKQPKNDPVLGFLPAHTKRAIVSVLLFVLAVFLSLAAFQAGGAVGGDTYALLGSLLGWGYFLAPLLCVVLGVAALREETPGINWVKLAASAVFFIAGLGFVEIVTSRGGLIGQEVAIPVIKLFDVVAGSIILAALILVALLVLIEGHITLRIFAPIEFAFASLTRWVRGQFLSTSETTAPLNIEEEDTGYDETFADEAEAYAAGALPSAAPAAPKRSTADVLRALLGPYNAPPLSLLERDRGKPGVGDIKANANIIKRTLQNFGIVVELDEISIGPSVTRYAIKPAEGVRLQKIVSLQPNLELALAQHPVRIEAPIPGKSLVGIEVPNSAKVTVGLGTMLGSSDFGASSKPLLVALGRDIAGASHFGNLGKMPHLLIAGATGSGKSVAIHTLITSLLYRNGPESLRLLLIDPKRVELTLYNREPHLLTPVITDPKKAIAALRWAGREMARRYDILEKAHVRDVESYHSNILRPKLERLKASGQGDAGEVPEAMPYIVIVIDELADIMQTFPRELEAAVVRLAQMSRAVGIHLVLSTQRPSVNVITGLIKANIPARMALQVASQVDSRTILDQAGAEKLLGAGDMLYLASDMGKPLRLQSAYINEDEVKRVVEYIAKHNEDQLPIDIGPMADAAHSGGGIPSFGDSFGEEEEVDDDMYEAARRAVTEAGKASTSYIQRKLRVGYARAARLMDMLEAQGVIGPSDGAKPREILGLHTTHEAETPEV